MIDTILSPHPSAEFDEQDRAVIAFARELTENVVVDDATFDRVKTFLDEAQLVDLVVNIGLANLNNRITHAFWVQPED